MEKKGHVAGYSDVIQRTIRLWLGVREDGVQWAWQATVENLGLF